MAGRMIAVFVAVLALGALLLWLRSGPDPTAFAHLKDPRLTTRAAERMLVVEATGDPNAVAGRAFKLLFAAYYRLPGISRTRPPAPRARWPHALGKPGIDWVGRYALPVPSAVTAVPTIDTEPGLSLTLQTWDYGEVVELLHVGPYSREQADIERLHAFVAAQGRRVIGEHEEEYVRGPGMFFAGDPEKYLTIVRLRVEAPPQL